MGNSNRDRLPPPSATPNSPAFREWLGDRQSAPASPPPSSASWRSGSGSGSGSGGGGYGIRLIAAGEASRERIQAIMRDILAREKSR